MMPDSLAIANGRATLDDLRKTLNEVSARLQDVEQQAIVQEKQLTNTTEAMAAMGGLNSDAFRTFMGKPYITLPQGKKNEVLLVVPKFVNFHAGWLIQETETYNVYRFDRYSAWLGDAPADLLKEIEFTHEFDASIDGQTIRFDEENFTAVKSRLRDHIKDVRPDSATILKGHEFQVIVEMINAGCLPFTARPVRKEDLRDPRAEITLREYQQPAFDKFLETGAVGIFHPTGAGKSIIAMKIMDVLRGRKLIIVPTTTLREQWEDLLQHWLPHLRDEITVATYMGTKYYYEEWTLVIYDECQHLPANTFSGLSLLRTKYRIGLSASPYREDGRENYIIALTGYPVGVNWGEYMQATGRTYHPITVYLVKDVPAKIKCLEKLLDRSKKTLIFADSIDLGKRISEKLKIPFIYGNTERRLSIIEDNKVVAISRVGDLGISVKDLERIIEIDFLFGSRQQELQRTGRLMHSQVREPQHDIIMTRDELAKYGKRLYALQEKGFRIQVRQ